MSSDNVIRLPRRCVHGRDLNLIAECPDCAYEERMRVAQRKVDLMKPAEDLTPEGIQLVIPGAERKPLPTQKQGELF